MAPDTSDSTLVLSVYEHLKNKPLKELGLFIVEGKYVTERLISSGWEMHSILVAEPLSEYYSNLPNISCPIWTLPEVEISKIIGYDFHRGILAAAYRPNYGKLETFLKSQSSNVRSRILVAPLVSEQENLGTIIRNGAALGATALCFGKNGCDPLDRRVVRVSMGTAFSLPLIEISDTQTCIDSLRSSGYSIVGTTLRLDAKNLREFRWPQKAAMVLGHESTGIPEEWEMACDELVTIPMRDGIDSLNLGVASGIMLWASQNL